MKKLSRGLAVLCLLSGPVLAAEYKCAGNRVEKGGVPQYIVRGGGSELIIEKDGRARGRAVRRGGAYVIEGGSGGLLALFEGGRVSRNGQPWATVKEAQGVYDCPDLIAATLWALEHSGEL